ncbi:hypothetical protein DRO54_04420 [Candidatus Bathyarchaeota archaeon]|nr:MAG: hypothetical protein DRO54_04420 [Candidatus Bathyarchaeota archaeon]
MVKSCDVGSLPPKMSHRELSEMFKVYEQGDSQLSNSLEELIVNSFLDKLLAGIDIPNYPQFRDMNEMFLQMINGIEKIREGYVEIESLSLKAGKEKIPEVRIIEKHSKRIFDILGESFRLKICITGPYTLSTLFAYKNEKTFLNLGKVLARIVKENLFSNKFGKVFMVTLDEPVFGVMSDPMVDYGSVGREALLKAWETILKEAAVRNVMTGMHLHSTADELFWYVESLKVVESHVDDPLYQRKANRRKLEEYDKFLKASICKTDYDQLIREKLAKNSQSKLELDERTAETWKGIRKGMINSKTFLEDKNLMKKRLEKNLETFGAERVLYAGPECGLGGFPNYETAIEYLRRVAEAVKEF